MSTGGPAPAGPLSLDGGRFRPCAPVASAIALLPSSSAASCSSSPAAAVDDEQSDDRGYVDTRGYGDAKAVARGAPTRRSPSMAGPGGERGDPHRRATSRPARSSPTAASARRSTASPSRTTPTTRSPRTSARRRCRTCSATAVCLGRHRRRRLRPDPGRRGVRRQPEQRHGRRALRGLLDGRAALLQRQRSTSTTTAPTQPLELPIDGNEPLQGEIAERFIYQVLPSVLSQPGPRHADRRPRGAAARRCRPARSSTRWASTCADRTGGHAITPFAVEDKGDGQFAILVYDNNFPGATRAVEVDTNEDTWSYVASTNPDEQSALYEGDARSDTLELDPLSPGARVPRPCPFCAGEAKGGGP